MNRSRPGFPCARHVSTVLRSAMAPGEQPHPIIGAFPAVSRQITDLPLDGPASNDAIVHPSGVHPSGSHQDLVEMSHTPSLRPRCSDRFRAWSCRGLALAVLAIALAFASTVAAQVAPVGSWTTGLSHTVGAGSDRLIVFMGQCTGSG